MRNDANAPLKLGVIGCGWAGQQAVHAAMAIPRIEVIALSDLEPDLIQNTLAAHPTIPCQYGPYQDLLQNADIDAVYLAVNPVMRYSMVLDAIAARKHVMVQKPHAVRADQILEFEAAAEEMGITLQFCYFMRHFPLNRQIRAHIDAGAIGEPYHGRVFLKYNTRPAPEGITRWLQVYGQKGGVLAQHASHEFNLAWWWLGAPEPRWAIAAKHVLNPVYDGPEGPAEDYLSGLVGFADGKTLQIDCSRWLHADLPTTIEVFGSEGAVSNREISHLTDAGYEREEVDAPAEFPHSNDTGLYFYGEIEYFARAIAGEVAPEPDAREAYQFMRILDGLYDSALTGERIEIVATTP